jgi:hypothetical protein
MSEKMNELMEKSPDKVKGVLNILMESPYFYRFDDEELFLFLRRNEPEFREFYREWFDWDLNLDDKCARVLKSEWFNKAITPANRLQFRLGKRDECIAFMLLIEFFEKTLEENSMTADEARNPMFKFGDLLEFQRQRFQELFKDDVETYTSEYIQRNILLPLMPQLVKHRFLNEEPRPKGMQLTREQYIYEMLPALYHYNSGRLNEAISNPNAEDPETIPTGEEFEPTVDENDAETTTTEDGDERE